MMPGITLCYVGANFVASRNRSGCCHVCCFQWSNTLHCIHDLMHACLLTFTLTRFPPWTYDHMVRTPTIIGGLMCCVPSHLCRVLHRDPR